MNASSAASINQSAGIFDNILPKIYNE